jgi:type II secretion system protein H
MKTEIRNPKSERNPRPEGRIGNGASFSDFRFRPSFGFRPSDFGPSRRAFTLLELIVVMALLAIVLAISSPALSRFFKARNLESEARRFMSLTRAAQNRAVSEGVPMILWLQPKEHAYGLKADKTFIEEDPKAEQFAMDATLEIEPRYSAEANTATRGSQFKNEKLDTTDYYTLRFNPDGFVSASSPEAVVFRQSDNGELWVAQSRNRLNYEIQPGQQVTRR